MTMLHALNQLMARRLVPVLVAVSLAGGCERAPRQAGGEAQALDIPLYAGEDVETGSLSRRAVDGLFELGTGLVRRAFNRG